MTQDVASGLGNRHHVYHDDQGLGIGQGLLYLSPELRADLFQIGRAKTQVSVLLHTIIVGELWSPEDIARATGRGLKAVKRAISSLQESGLLAKALDRGVVTGDEDLGQSHFTVYLTNGVTWVTVEPGGSFEELAATV